MSAVRSRDNRAELMLRRALSKRDLRFRLHVDWLPGRPDVVFVSARVAVFVDGDFWHGRIFHERGPDALAASLRTTRRAWWIDKLMRNVERDAIVTAALKGLGFSVMRVWERDVIRDPERVAAAVKTKVEKRLRGVGRK